MFLHNNTLKQMFSTVKRLRSEYTLSRSSMYPKADFIGVAGKSGGNTVDTIYTGDDFSVSVPVSYEIDVWKKLRSQSGAIMRESEAAVYDRQALSVTLAAELMERYYTGLYLRQLLLLRDIVAQHAGHLTNLVSHKYEMGMATKDEVYTQKQNETELAAKRRALEEGLVHIEHALSVLMGDPPQDGWLRGAFSVPSWLNEVPQNLSADPATQRPDLLSLQRQMESAGLKIKAARGASFPSFYLTGYSRNTTEDINAFYKEEGFGWGAFVGVQFPIFDGKRHKATLEIQHHAADELQEEYHLLLLKAMSETKSAFNSGKNQNEIVKVLKERNTLIAKSLIITQAQYDVGTEDLLKLTSEKQKFILARMEHSKQQLQLVSSRILLLRAMGKGWWKK